MSYKGSDMYFDLNYVIEQVGKEKGIPKEIIIETLEEAVLSASKKKFGNHLDLEAKYNPEAGEIEIFRFKTVVEDVEDDDMEISIEDAKEHDPECIMGDSIGIKMDTSTLGRIAAQTAKQVIMQKVRNAESDVIYNEYKDKKSEIVTGVIQRVEKSHYVVNLGKTEAILSFKEVIPNEVFKRRDRVKGYILDVEKTQRGCTILLSRSHPGFLVKLFEIEVPEIQEGIIKVVGAAREPGERAKIAVYSQDASIDPIGACVGVKGSRVQAVVQELKGEKIDIIPWSKDAAKFVCNALAPGAGFQGLHKRGRALDGDHRPRRPAFACNRQERPEREARLPAHGMEDGHKERNGGREDVAQGHRRADQPAAGQRDTRPHTLRRVPERYERYSSAFAGRAEQDHQHLGSRTAPG